MADNKEMLHERYKFYSDEELQEITVANGYTEDAEQVARQILGGDRTEFKEYIKQQEEKHQKEYYNMSNGNAVGGILKAIGILIMIFGTIGSIYIASQGHEFSFVNFIIPELGTIISGMIFLGFSEIIQLLQDIKDKMK